MENNIHTNNQFGVTLTASGESWKYSTGKKGVHAFGYNCPESESIGEAVKTFGKEF